MSLIVPEPKKDLIKTLKEIPEEILWIANFNSDASIETYQQATADFKQLFGIVGNEQMAEITHAHIIAYRNYLKQSGKSPRTVNTRLSALSSLFNHLIERQLVKINPVVAVKRMKINNDRVEAKVLTPVEVRQMLDNPDGSTLKGKRDRVILGILFFTGCRVSEVRKLKVKDVTEEQGFNIMDFQIKGGKRNRLAIHQELHHYLEEYLLASGHRDNKNHPLILPLMKNKSLPSVRHLSSRMIELLWAKIAVKLGIKGTSPHSARATFITQALENNCPIEDVQTTVGHSLIKTTQTYDKRQKQLRKSASFSVRY